MVMIAVYFLVCVLAAYIVPHGAGMKNLYSVIAVLAPPAKNHLERLS
jgi:hypothetical protein